jgi:hypothetical protein
MIADTLQITNSDANASTPGTHLAAVTEYEELLIPINETKIETEAHRSISVYLDNRKLLRLEHL